MYGFGVETNGFGKEIINLAMCTESSTEALVRENVTSTVYKKLQKECKVTTAFQSDSHVALLWCLMLEQPRRNIIIVLFDRMHENSTEQNGFA